jgi:hypothetical protein
VTATSTSLLQIWADDAAPRVVDDPAVVGVRTYERVADYAYAAPDGRRWLTIHDLDDAGAVDDLVATGSKAGDGPDAATVTRFEQIWPTGGWLTADGVVAEGGLPEGDAVLSVVMDVAEEGLDLFTGWYEEEHLPKLVAVPGIDAARRFRAVEGALAQPGRLRYLALYEFASLELLRTEAWAQAASMTPRTEQIVPYIVMMSQLYRR